MDASSSSRSLQADGGMKWAYVNHITTLQKKTSAQWLELKKKRNTKTETTNNRISNRNIYTEKTKLLLTIKKTEEKNKY